MGLQDRIKRKDRKEGRTSGKKQGGRGGTLGDIRGLREKIGTKTYLHGPMDYPKTLKLQFRVWNLDLPETRDLPVVGRRRKMHRCALVAGQKRVELTLYGNVKCTMRSGMCWRRWRK